MEENIKTTINSVTESVQDLKQKEHSGEELIFLALKTVMETGVGFEVNYQQLDKG